MSQIKSGRLDMRARWIYVAQKIGLRSGMALTSLILVFLLNIFFFYIQTNNLLPFLHEGANTWQEILHSLPYDLVIIILTLILILNFIVKKFDFSYKKPFKIMFSFVIGIVILGAIMLFISNFNFTVRNSLNRGGYYVPYLSHFYMERCPMYGNR